MMCILEILYFRLEKVHKIIICHKIFWSSPDNTSNGYDKEIISLSIIIVIKKSLLRDCDLGIMSPILIPTLIAGGMTVAVSPLESKDIGDV